ncbi:hypothetical protein BLA29_011541, partial [Euroglyphus maynei]
MRIGIHTGMILSGLLGLKKWQFDIWSIDTMKASQMEQEGRPGFVHITMASLQQIPADLLQNLSIIENNVLKNETTYLIQRTNIATNDRKPNQSINYLSTKEQSTSTIDCSLSSTSSSIDPQLPHHNHNDDCMRRLNRQVSIVEEDVFLTAATNSHQDQQSYGSR